MEDGRSLRGLVVGDDPAAWRSLGFSVEGDRCTVGGVTLRFVGDRGDRGVLAWSLAPPVPEPVDGLAHDDVGAPARSAHHPNGARLVDHLVVGSTDVERTTAALAAIGVTPRRTVAGLGGHDGTVFRFFLLGTCLLELIGPSRPTGSGAPARFRGLAFVVDDLDATAAGLGEWCGPPHDAVQPGRRIASLRHEEAGIGVPVAFLTPR